MNQRIKEKHDEFLPVCFNLTVIITTKAILPINRPINKPIKQVLRFVKQKNIANSTSKIQMNPHY
jgi:hypothetical protein